MSILHPVSCVRVCADSLRTTTSTKALELTPAQLKSDILQASGIPPRTLFDSFHYPPVPKLRAINEALNLVDEQNEPPVKYCGPSCYGRHMQECNPTI